LGWCTLPLMTVTSKLPIKKLCRATLSVGSATVSLGAADSVFVSEPSRCFRRRLRYAEEGAFTLGAGGSDIVDGAIAAIPCSEECGNYQILSNVCGIHTHVLGGCADPAV
jgi:hypothetical protein